MKSHVFSSRRLTVDLEKPSERFKTHNDKGFLFEVSRVTYTGGNNVTLRGPAVNADGYTSVAISREVYMSIEELPIEILVSLLKASMEKA